MVILSKITLGIYSVSLNVITLTSLSHFTFAATGLSMTAPTTRPTESQMATLVSTSLRWMRQTRVRCGMTRGHITSLTTCCSSQGGGWVCCPIIIVRITREQVFLGNRRFIVTEKNMSAPSTTGLFSASGTWRQRATFVHCLEILLLASCTIS